MITSSVITSPGVLSHNKEGRTPRFKIFLLIYKTKFQTHNLFVSEEKQEKKRGEG